MKQRKPTRKTGSTRRAAKANAPKRKTARPARGKAGRASSARGAGAVALPVECAIASVPELRDRLLKRLTHAGNVQIDASAVQRIDTAALQVLAAFARDRREGSLPVEWLGVPGCLTEAATLLDLTDVLGLQGARGA
jgi:ABC-type transporter Mla MlaB component